jgi:hypothetical protein
MLGVKVGLVVGIVDGTIDGALEGAMEGSRLGMNGSPHTQWTVPDSNETLPPSPSK